MNDGVAGPLWTEQMPTEQISVESPPDVIAAWLLQLGFPEQAMCVLKLQVTGHVLGHLSTADMMTSLGFLLHGDAMRVLSQARECLQGSDLHLSSGFMQGMCPVSVAQWLEDCKLSALAEKFLERTYVAVASWV